MPRPKQKPEQGENQDTNKQYFRADIDAGTLDVAARSFDVVFATDTPVLRYSWMREEYYYEVLRMGGANLERASGGLPLLDNHETWGSVRRNTLGRANDVRFDGSVYRAKVTLSKRDELNDLWQDIQDGIVKDISFGYSVDEAIRLELKEGEKYRTYDISKWTPKEISLVNIPADPKSGVRSGDLFTLNLRSLNEDGINENVIINNEQIMKREEIIAMLAQRGITVAPDITDEALRSELDKALNVRSGGDTSEAEIKAAVEGERKRSNEITMAVRAAKLPSEFGEKLITEGKSIDEARAEIIAEFAKKDPMDGVRGHNAEVGTDREHEMRKEAIATSLIMRNSPELLTGAGKPSDDVIKEAQKYRHETLYDLAKASLVRAGENVEGLDKMTIVGRAITSSTSDFPVYLEGANRTTLLAAYATQSDTWRKFCATGSVSDFREYKRLRPGSLSNLDDVQENGEFKNKKLTDGSYEKVSIGTKGNIINVSRKMIINDDLGAFLGLAKQLGRAAARSIEADVYKLLAMNSGNGPTMADGNPLFHSSHNNIATAAYPTVDSLTAVRLLMASWKDKDNNDFLDIRPHTILSPMALENVFNLLNGAQFDPNSTKFELPNVVRGMFNQVIGTPRLTGNPWYAFADPNEVPAIEVNFLNGQQTPYMETEQGFTVDGMSWKIRHDYGVSAVDYHGVVINKGANPPA